MVGKSSVIYFNKGNVIHHYALSHGAHFTNDNQTQFMALCSVSVGILLLQQQQ